MNKIILLVSSIIMVGLLFLVLGVSLGVSYKTQQGSFQLERTTAAVKFLSSKIVPSIVAYGQVTKIEGKDIVLSYSGDSIKVSMEQNSQVYSSINDSAGKLVQKKVMLKEIKVGDNLSITMKLSPDGQLYGQSVFILLPFNNSVNKK